MAISVLQLNCSTLQNEIQYGSKALYKLMNNVVYYKKWKMDPEGNIKGEYRNTLKKCGVYDMLKRKCVFLKNEGAEKG